MPLFTTRICALFLLLAITPLLRALTNDEVIKMQKAGLSEETILLTVQNAPAEYETSADALIELKNEGVPEKVIQKMIARSVSSEPTPATVPTPTHAPASASAPALAPTQTSAEGGLSAAFAQDFPSVAPAFVNPVAGQDYFTRYTFHEEDNKHITTNYARGEAVPINTPVKLVSISASAMVLKRADTGLLITVKNEQKYSRKSMTEIARLMLAAEKTPLEKLPEEVAAAVRAGELRKGMTKEIVLMTRGYPPAHETPSIEGDRWVYWSSRFVKLTIVFANGRLAEGRGIY